LISYLYNFTYIFFIWTVTHHFHLFYLLRNIWTIQLQKDQKILWVGNEHFLQINVSKNVFTFIAYINFAQYDFMSVSDNLQSNSKIDKERN
jgi:hypothetical protein